MSEVVYRVDSELLTCVTVSKDNLSEDTPIGYWIPALFGNGEYCYFTGEDEAKRALFGILEQNIAVLQKMKHDLMQ